MHSQACSREVAAAPSVPQEPSRTDARVDAEAERVGAGDERPAERADLAEGTAQQPAEGRTPSTTLGVVSGTSHGVGGRRSGLTVGAGKQKHHPHSRAHPLRYGATVNGMPIDQQPTQAVGLQYMRPPQHMDMGHGQQVRVTKQAWGRATRARKTMCTRISNFLLLP